MSPNGISIHVSVSKESLPFEDIGHGLTLSGMGSSASTLTKTGFISRNTYRGERWSRGQLCSNPMTAPSHETDANNNDDDDDAY